MKRVVIFIISIVGLLVISIGSSYAFFFVTNNNTSMETDVTAALLANIEFVHGNGVVVPEGGVYPGWVGVQEFTIKKPDGMNEGIGAFQIVLETNIDPVFNDYLNIEVYKTTDFSVTVDKVDGDIVSDPSDPNKVYVQDYIENEVELEILTHSYIDFETQSGNIVIDEQNFDLSTYEDTKYFLVYYITNANGNQNHIMNKSFTTSVVVNPISRFTRPSTYFIQDVEYTLSYNSVEIENLYFNGSDKSGVSFYLYNLLDADSNTVYESTMENAVENQKINNLYVNSEYFLAITILDENNNINYKLFRFTTKGDVNGDGLVNSLDTTAVENHISGHSLLADLDLGDINGDSVINQTDIDILEACISGVCP